ncbi:MAG: glycosyltransferase family 9 protein [Vampirovibrionales bacterium]|nr:glycosyltransferase family 9 protein [Vampirovibrionales bacterium]
MTKTLSKKAIPKKLGLLNVGGIGDNLLFSPVIHSLRQVFKEHSPSTQLVMLLERRSQAAIDLMPPLDEVICLDIQGKPKTQVAFETWQALKSNGLDGIISCGSSKPIAPLLWASGVPFKVGFDAGILSKNLLTATTPLKSQAYAGTMYHALAESALEALGLPQPEVRLLEPRIALTPADMAWYREAIVPLLPSNNKLLVLVHPGVSQLSIDKGIVKRWHPKRWAEAIAQLSPHATVMLAGGPDDADTITAIQQTLATEHSQAAASLVSLAGVTKSLRHLAVIMAHMQLVLCTDSAPMHVAVGVEAPIVALFGDLDPVRLLPPHPRYMALKETVGITRTNPAYLEISVEAAVSATLSKLLTPILL